MNELKEMNDEISFKEVMINLKIWISYLLGKWKIIFVAGICGGVLGLTYAIIKKPIYTATVTFVLESDGNSGGGLGGALGLASQFGIDLGGDAGGMFVGANLIELFKSRTMVEKALLSPAKIKDRKISLMEVYIQEKGWRKNWAEGDSKFKNIHFSPDGNRKSYTREQDSILGVVYFDLLKNSLSVGQKDKKISVISIDMSSTNELFAKEFSETLADVVSNFYIKAKSKRSRVNMLTLERQTDSIRRELNSAITGVAVANDNAFNLNPALNVKRTPSARKQVDVQANTAILAELLRQTELAKVTLRQDTPLIQIIDKPIMPLSVDRFGKLMGLIMGGFLGGFFCSLWFLLKKYFTFD